MVSFIYIYIYLYCDFLVQSHSNVLTINRLHYDCTLHTYRGVYTTRVNTLPTKCFTRHSKLLNFCWHHGIIFKGQFNRTQIYHQLNRHDYDRVLHTSRLLIQFNSTQERKSTTQNNQPLNFKITFVPFVPIFITLTKPKIRINAIINIIRAWSISKYWAKSILKLTNIQKQKHVNIHELKRYNHMLYNVYTTLYHPSINNCNITSGMF